MHRIYERHDDVGTLGVYLYEKESVLYVDKECTKEATVEDAHYAFLRRGVVVLENGGMAEITSFSENESAAKSITYGASASEGTSATNPVLYLRYDGTTGALTLYKQYAGVNDATESILATAYEIRDVYYKGNSVECNVDGGGESEGKIVAMYFTESSTDAYVTAVVARPVMSRGMMTEVKLEMVSVTTNLTN